MTHRSPAPSGGVSGTVTGTPGALARFTGDFALAEDLAQERERIGPRRGEQVGV